MYDDIRNPGFVFFPTDLQYFIDYEHDDAIARVTSKRPRHVPSSLDYRQHQETNGAITFGRKGGLFRRVILNKQEFEQREGDIEPDRTWHGEPIYAIRRAMMVLGSLDTVPDTQNQLMTLWQLYNSSQLDSTLGLARAESTKDSDTSSESSGDDQADGHTSNPCVENLPYRSAKRKSSKSPRDKDPYEGSSAPKRQRCERTGLDEPSEYLSTNQEDWIQEWLIGLDPTAEDEKAQDVSHQSRYVTSVA